MDLSCAGVAPTLIADGGLVPWAGESELREEKVKSPNPLLSFAYMSSGAFAAGERGSASIDAGDEVLFAEGLVLVLVRPVFDEVTVGVRFLVDGTGISSWAGSAPVIVSSASLTSSGVFSHGILRLGRVDLDFVTNPSLSSLKLLTVSIAFVTLMVVVFACCLRGAGLGCATRVVEDATFALGGRGIVAHSHRDVVQAIGREPSPANVVAGGPRK